MDRTHRADGTECLGYGPPFYFRMRTTAHGAKRPFGNVPTSAKCPKPEISPKGKSGTCVITFGIGATLTGLAITLTEDTDTTGRE
jgi:hypothetical protein